MFIGRKHELKILEETYAKEGFQMTVIYGRRRIGKSTLIAEFIKNKRASYYVASQNSLEINVQKWSKQFVNDISPELDGVAFDDLEKFFNFVGSLCGDEKIIVALDEIPYIAEADSSFVSRFQVAIDTIFTKKNIFLIICGSAVSFMEKEILSEKSPLFGRRSNQIFLKPFDYMTSALFTPHYINEEKAIVYGVTGGVAKYLSLFDDNKSLDDNLISNFFKSSGYLYEEPFNLLTQEFRTINTYNSVIEVCANGANKVSEIADKAHISTATLNFILKNLMTVGIISRKLPITEDDSKKKITYEITDGIYRFWYTYVSSARPAIETDRGEIYYNRFVKEKLHLFMGKVFEEMCQYYTLVQGLDGKLNCFVTRTGSWWGIGHNRIPTDIDVVGIDEPEKKAILGECKFKKEVIDKGVYDDLMDRSGLINNRYKEVQYLFFSLSGYSKWMIENTDPATVKLLTLDDLYK